MVKRLIAQQIEAKRRENPCITEIGVMFYHLKRNAKAYKSHSKKTIQLLM